MTIETPQIDRLLPLYRSWALADVQAHLPLLADPAIDAEALGARGAGYWHCALSDNRLSWTDGVFDLFGMARGSAVRREDAVLIYANEARETMERLRAYAIKHRRGFTLDAELRAGGTQRWMRLVAVPILDGAKVIGLHGTKQDVTQAYRQRRNRIDPAIL